MIFDNIRVQNKNNLQNDDNIYQNKINKQYRNPADNDVMTK